MLFLILNMVQLSVINVTYKNSIDVTTELLLQNRTDTFQALVLFTTVKLKAYSHWGCI